MSIHTYSIYSQVPLKKSLLDSSDVFILDLGLTIFQYNGKTCNKDEKYRAVQYLQDLKSKRPKAKAETLEEEDLVCSMLYFYTVYSRVWSPDMCYLTNTYSRTSLNHLMHLGFFYLW